MNDDLRLVQSARDGLALEAALFAAREPGVAVWSSLSHSIVCPESLSRKFGLSDLAEFDGRPIITRPTGGGAVPQGLGILNLAISYDAAAGASIEDGYVCLTGILKDGLSDLGLDLAEGQMAKSFCDGAWNLTAQGKKLAGTAQRWKPLPDGGFRVLAHALLLVDADIERSASVIAALHRYLGLPPVDPKAHGTLSGFLDGKSLDHAAIANRLVDASWSRLLSPRRTRAA